MKEIYLKTPISREDIEQLNIGDVVYLENLIYTARDMAHKYLKENYHIEKNQLVDFNGSAIFHAGPIVSLQDDGSYSLVAIGPTTSFRMEPYTDFMGEIGVKALIGKGGMGIKTTEAMKKNKMIYLVAAHGCSTTHCENIEKVEQEFWMKEFGMPEAMWVMKCKNFGPLIVGIDSKGRNIFEEVKKYSYDKANELYPDM